MTVKRKIIEIDEEKCDGCGQCILSCAEGAIEIVDGKAKVISDNLCDGLGACIGNCPQDALEIVEREADEFDEEAVEEHLANQEQAQAKTETIACGCPSTQIQEFNMDSNCACASANEPVATESSQSALSHWPVQIRLVPATAPFLKDADLLVVADCAPLAYPDVHRDFLKGRAVMMGCPKFDNREEYIAKFTEVFKTAGIKSITCLNMEVPCCAGLPAILIDALEAYGKPIPFEIVVIGNRGQVVERKKVC